KHDVGQSADPTGATACRPRPGQALSNHLVAAGRVPLPARAHLLAVFRRGAGTVRSVGRRLDDARPAVALPSLGNVRARLRAARTAAPGALVSPLAVWKMARREPGSRLAILALPLNPARSA